MNSPAIEASGAAVIDQLTGVGVGFTILVLALGFSVFANIMQFKRNSSLTDQMFALIPTATASVLQAVHEFREAVNELTKKT